jgi:endonuclease/exonuclease/phosphatase (EEP) superfamily protein YafD
MLRTALFLLSLPALPPTFAPWFHTDWWLVDLLACFPVQAGIVCLISTLLLGLFLRSWLALPFLVGTLSAGVLVLPDMLLKHEPRPSSAIEVRALTINLLRENTEHARTIEVITKLNPDLLFVSECTPEWAARLESALNWLPHRSLHPDSGHFGVALFSRWPLEQAAVLRLGVDWAPALRAVVKTPGRPLGLIGVHPPAPIQPSWRVFRDQALADLRECLSALPPERIVLGDFNATPWNAGMRRLLREAQLTSATNGGWHPTWPTDLPAFLRLPIDHVLVGGSIGMLSSELGESTGSDHLPLLAYLLLPARL